MDADLRTFATGGGTGGEGIKIWDLRDLSKSTTNISWGQSASGDKINRCYNTVKFVPGMSLVLAGCTDNIPAKAFNFKTGCNVVQDFHQLKRSCFSIDVSRDATQVALGDYCGNIQVDNIVKAHV
jgi:WD40 repeat protein